MGEKLNPKISIIIVNFNSGGYLFKTVNSILKNFSEKGFEVIIVDNNSSDDSLKKVKNDERIKIIRLEKNIGFGAANNRGVKEAKGEYILILNNDTLVQENSIEKLIDFLEKNPEFSAVGPLVLYPDKSFQLSFGKEISLFNEFILKFFYERYYKLIYKIRGKRISREVDWLSGVCFLIKKSLYEKIGGFDENFFIYLEDCDFFKRLKEKGHRAYFFAEPEIIHFKGKTTKKYLSFVYPLNKKSQLYYYCKHKKGSFPLLKLYLKLRLSLKLLFSKNKDIIKNTLKVVKDYEC